MTANTEAEIYNAWAPRGVVDIARERVVKGNLEFLGLGGSFNVTVRPYSEIEVRAMLKQAASRADAVRVDAPVPAAQHEPFSVLENSLFRKDKTESETPQNDSSLKTGPKF